MKQIIIALALSLLVENALSAEPSSRPWWNPFAARPTPSPSVTVPKPLVVVEIANDGAIFGFDKLMLDRILGRANWQRERLWASRTPNGDRRAIMLWRSSAGMPTTGHGRYDDRHKAKDWHKRDKIYVFEKPK